MKLLTWVSIQCALSVIPKVTYFKLKCFVMLYLSKNIARFTLVAENTDSMHLLQRFIH